MVEVFNRGCRIAVVFEGYFDRFSYGYCRRTIGCFYLCHLSKVARAAAPSVVNAKGGHLYGKLGIEIDMLVCSDDDKLSVCFPANIIA